MATPHVDRQTFLANLRQSGLVSENQLVAVRERLPDTNRGRVIARALVECGLLTKFQAEMLLAGRTGGFVLGQYRILDQLGQGGMGRVFKALHTTMNRVVALKVLAPQLVETDKAQQLFHREMQAAARLHHPNIVTAYDANRVGDRYYLVMEYVDGPNLDRLVRENGPLPVGQACEFARQAALGLQHAHEVGMVHRDIKPANLLLQRFGPQAAERRCTVKILDFGLARLSDPGEADGPDTIPTRPNVIMGTPDYVAPEQARDLHSADIRADLYSLGCTLYFLLTGRVPFPGGSSLEKLVRHMSLEPVPVEQLRPEVPPGVAAIVRRLLAKRPADRFQTPAELAAALAPYAAEGAVWPGSDAEIIFGEMVGAAGLSDSGVNLGANPARLDEIATLAADQCPTPMSVSRLSLLGYTEPERRRWRLALALAVAIVFGLLAAGGLLSWLIANS
jgi:eukaryotic-like serine/threonine-protein kinase